MTKTEQQRIGALGESIAANFLARKGFSLLDKNYRKPWGELDLICLRGKIVVFVEVKSVSRETNQNVSNKDDFRPEDNMHTAKIERLQRAIQTYLSEKHLEKSDWRLDLVTVQIDVSAKVAHCKHVEGIW